LEKILEIEAALAVLLAAEILDRRDAGIEDGDADAGSRVAEHAARKESAALHTGSEVERAHRRVVIDENRARVLSDRREL